MPAIASRAAGQSWREDRVGWREDRLAGTYVRTEEPSTLRKLAFAALWLLVFAIPWEDAVWLPNFGTAARLVGMLATGLGALAFLERGRIRFPSTAHIVMILFTIWAAVSYLWSAYPEATARQAFTYGQLLIMVWLIWELCPGDRQQTRLMQAYVFGTFVSSIDAVRQYFAHQEVVYQRYTGAGLNADQLGLVMAVSLPISYYLLIQSRRPLAWVYGVQLALAETSMLLSAGRGGFLAGLMALSIVPVTSKSLTSRQRITIFCTIFLVVCSGLYLVPSTSWDRISTIPDEITHGSLNERTVVWGACWEFFRMHPFLGIGAGAFRESATHFLAIPMIPHNTFLGVLAEQGIIGFALFCALLAVMALSVKDIASPKRELWMVFLAVWGVAACDLTWENGKSTWFFFGLLIAQSAVTVRKQYAVVRPRKRRSVARPLPVTENLFLGNRAVWTDDVQLDTRIPSGFDWT